MDKLELISVNVGGLNTDEKRNNAVYIHGLNIMEVI